MTAELESDEAAAWAEVLGRWDDEAAHRAFLDRCRDLDALARAGGRYRDVLAARPGDAAALRGREEVLRRATAAGLATLPRTPAGVPVVPRWVRPAGLVLLGLVIVAASVLLFRTVASWGRF